METAAEALTGDTPSKYLLLRGHYDILASHRFKPGCGEPGKLTAPGFSFSGIRTKPTYSPRHPVFNSYFQGMPFFFCYLLNTIIDRVPVV